MKDIGINELEGKTDPKLKIFIKLVLNSNTAVHLKPKLVEKKAEKEQPRNSRLWCQGDKTLITQITGRVQQL